MRCEMAYANSCCPTTPNMRLLRWTAFLPTTCGLDWPVTKKRSRKSALSVREEGRACYSIGLFSAFWRVAEEFSRFRQHARAMAKNASEVIFWITAENLHATAEPRPATAQDQGLLPCELAQICQDSVLDVFGTGVGLDVPQG